MSTVLNYLLAAAGRLRSRVAAARPAGDAGYTTETVVVTAALIILAITVIAIIVAKVTAAANAINLG